MIKIHNINKSYQDGVNKRIILRNIGLGVGRNEKISIVGKSGSGKSTLINSIIGSVFVDTGTIKVNNKIYKSDADYMSEIRRELFGVIYQNDYLFDEFTAIENIRLAQNIKGYEDEDEAKEIISKLGLTKVQNNYPSNLSGGERQRVSIGRAMVNNPKIIIADEPTGSLDEKLAEEIVNILLKQDAAIIMVTHDLDLANRFEKVYVLENGELKLN